MTGTRRVISSFDTYSAPELAPVRSGDTAAIQAAKGNRAFTAAIALAWVKSSV